MQPFFCSHIYGQTDEIKGDIVRIDSSIVLPILTDSLGVCESLKKLWLTYVETDDYKNYGIDYMKDSNFYVARIFFTITKSGDVKNTNAREFYSHLDSILTSIYSNQISKLKWTPGRSSVGKKKTFNENAILYFQINRYEFRIYIEAIDQTETIFECSSYF